MAKVHLKVRLTGILDALFCVLSEMNQQIAWDQSQLADILAKKEIFHPN